MIEKLIKKMAEARTPEELLAFKPEVEKAYDDLYEKIDGEFFIGIANYEDIKSLHALKMPMMAYYGPSFYKECGIPFLKEHNTKTIDIIEFIVLFYSLQVLELLESGYWKETYLCIINEKLDEIEGMEKVDFATRYKEKNEGSLLFALWYYFIRMLNLTDKEYEIQINEDCFYVGTEDYEKALNVTFRNFADSKYQQIIETILGRYRTRFTKMLYILKYQPIFVDVAYEYLCAIA